MGCGATRPRVGATIGRQSRVVDDGRAHPSRFTDNPRFLKKLAHLSLPDLADPPRDQEVRPLDIDKPHISQNITRKTGGGGVIRGESGGYALNTSRNSAPNWSVRSRSAV